MSQENVEIFNRSLRAFQNGDFEAWVDSFAEGGDFIPQRAPIQGEYRGHEGIRRFLADNEENFDVFEPFGYDVRDCGDRVLAIGTLRVRGKGSGVEIEVRSAIVVAYRDGKAIRFQDFGDRRAALEAVGLPA